MWKDRPRLSRRLREAFDKNSDDNVLGPLLISLAESDGRVPPVPSGLRRLRLKVTATDDYRDGWKLGWRAERVAGVDGDTLAHPGGHLVVTARGEGALYVISGDVPDLKQGLEKGLAARGERLGISLQPRRHPLILQEDPLGGWTEVDNASPNRASLVIFDEQGELEARSLVQRAGFEWEEWDDSSVDGWRVATDLEFDDGPGDQRTRLVGGLHLRVTGERRHYLVGGEPDLVPPPGADVVHLDGVPISTGGRPTELRGRGLAHGEHRIDAGARQLTFFLHAPRRPVPFEAPGPSRARTQPSPFEGSTIIDAEGRYTDLIPTAPPLWWRERRTGLGGEPETMESPIPRYGS
ncbi:hypothetical protein [Sphaerisporangium album]|uniref:hypothetical protein n=1 Tax=Sphaerisporangium album TaxID=509200 RepID=UPI0011C02B38|nr:hypothetical protein [Sphaerisporangium album]